MDHGCALRRHPSNGHNAGSITTKRRTAFELLAAEHGRDPARIGQLIGWLNGIVQFDIGEPRAADDSFLRLRGQSIPALKIVEVFLDDDIAAAGERGVLFADEHGLEHRLAPRIFRPIDEADEVAVVEETETVHFIYRRDGIPDARHDLRRKLEA